MFKESYIWIIINLAIATMVTTIYWFTDDPRLFGLLVFLILIDIISLISLKRTIKQHKIIPLTEMSSGRLVVDTVNPDREVFSLELDEDLPYLSQKKTIYLEVVHR